MADVEVDVAGRRLRLTNLDKVLWPQAGFTKGQMISYYVDISAALLPHLRGRPLTLKRYPDGVAGVAFFQKQCPGHPEWMATHPEPSVMVEGKILNYCVVNDVPSLVWVANLGSIELHPLLATAEDVRRPAALVLDLDPGAPANVLDACRIGLRLRQLLADVGLRACPKTSGKGLHVYVPLDGRSTYDHTKPFARALAKVLAAERPEEVTDRMDKRQRSGRVFIDWSQNDPTKTTVAAYSLRAKERPVVSTPLSWDEVESAVQEGDPEALVFEADQVVARVRERGDLFGEVSELRQALPVP